VNRRIETKGIKGFEDYMRRLPDIALKASTMAINDTARKITAQAKKEILTELKFPKSYLNQRLNVIQFAKGDVQEAVIQGRQRATSLARFGAASLGKGNGVRVNVGRKGGKTISKAFLMKLNRGRGGSGGFNTGLALRLKKGESIKNKKVPYSKTGDPGLVLLYGPSVQQAFQQILPDLADDANEILGKEFNRQFERLSK